ncbi:MAG: hypothetical protein HFI82_08400 [Eubacterium sp.]|jgi:hypothetical protein|nr:hypothetical protein [Eubacterium sp.]
MKRAIVAVLTAAVLFSLSGCGGKQGSSESNQESEVSEYAEPLEALEEIMAVYDEEDLFAMYGGNQENPVMDAPGKFDISKTEELENIFGLPQDQISNIEDAASMVHMMNANTFTGAAYRLKDGVDPDDFAEAVKTSVLAKQWLCGQPDTLLIADVDGSCVITAFGEAAIMENFKYHLLSVHEDAEVITEAPIA